MKFFTGLMRWIRSRPMMLVADESGWYDHIGHAPVFLWRDRWGNAYMASTRWGWNRVRAPSLDANDGGGA